MLSFCVFLFLALFLHAGIFSGCAVISAETGKLPIRLLKTFVYVWFHTGLFFSLLLLFTVVVFWSLSPTPNFILTSFVFATLLVGAVTFVLLFIVFQVLLLFGFFLPLRTKARLYEFNVLVAQRGYPPALVASLSGMICFSDSYPEILGFMVLACVWAALFTVTMVAITRITTRSRVVQIAQEVSLKQKPTLLRVVEGSVED